MSNANLGGMKVPEVSMSIHELDAGFNHFLDEFKCSAEAESHGVVLVTSVPFSRATAAQAISSPLPMTVATYNVMETECEGLFQIDAIEIYETTSSEFGGNEESTDSCSAEKLFQKLHCDNLGEHCFEIKSKAKRLREALKIDIFPITAPDPRVKEACIEAGAPQMYGTYITIRMARSISPLRPVFARLTTIYFHHRGAPRTWFVIPPCERSKFEEKVQEVFANEEGISDCSQYMRDFELWIQPTVLAKWGIRFYEVKQEEDQLVIFHPGTHFYGFCHGLSVLESKLHAGVGWEPLVNSIGKQKVAARRGDKLLDSPKPELNGIEDANVTTSHDRKRQASQPTNFEPQGKRPSHHQPVHGSSAAYLASTESTGTNVSEEMKLLGLALPNKPQMKTEENSGGKQNIVSTSWSTSTDKEQLNISGEDGKSTAMVPDSADVLILQLQQENETLLRDLALVRWERESLRSRKSVYKSRVSEQERVIAGLEDKMASLETLKAENMKE